MNLLEILNKPADYKIDVAKNDRFVASAVIKGREIVFAVELIGRVDPDSKWVVRDGDRGQDIWEMSFAEMQPTHAGMKKGTYQLTKSGGEFEVFATWRKFMEEFLQRYHPGKIVFTADKDHSRADLYAKLLKRFNMPGYKVNREEFGKVDKFVIIKESRESYQYPPFKNGEIVTRENIKDWADVNDDLGEVVDELGSDLKLVYELASYESLGKVAAWWDTFERGGIKALAEDKWWYGLEVDRINDVVEAVKKDKKIWLVFVAGDAGETMAAKGDVITGYHRLAAYKILGLKKIPVIYAYRDEDVK